MIKYFLLILAAIVLVSCGSDQETILFSSSRNGNSDIFIMNKDGSDQIPLTRSSWEEWSPTWINANEISFLRQKGDSIIRIKLNLNTRQEFELPQPINCVLDDKNMLYASSNDYQLYSCQNDLFLLNEKTGEITNITESLTGAALYPSWSNDGSRLVFTSNHLGANEIFAFDIARKEIKQLTDSGANSERGELSPSGNYLVYSSDVFEKGNQDIALKNLETGAIANIAESPGNELIARFSRDGKDLFYGSNKDGNWEIYAYNLASGKTTRLTHNDTFDGDPRVYQGR